MFFRRKKNGQRFSQKFLPLYYIAIPTSYLIFIFSTCVYKFEYFLKLPCFIGEVLSPLMSEAFSAFCEAA